MKFAKELEEDLVPEWRVKYFNYKSGKKRVKAVSRALRNANRTPQIPGRPHLNPTNSHNQLPFTHYDFNTRHEQPPKDTTPQPKNDSRPQGQGMPTKSSASPQRPQDLDRRESVTMFAHSPSASVPERFPDEDQQQQQQQNDQQQDQQQQQKQQQQQRQQQDQLEHEGIEEQDHNDEVEHSSESDNVSNEDERPLQKHSSGIAGQNKRRYGSIVGTPPEESPVERLSTLQLPDPALDPSKQRPPTIQGASTNHKNQPSPDVPKLSRAPTNTSGHAAQQSDRKKLSSLPNLPQKLFHRHRGRSADPFASKKKMKHTFTTLALDSPALTTSQFDAYRELDAKQDEFFTFLDKELDKIEKFYKLKENEAASRLVVIRDQLHEMRDRRLEDLRIAKRGGKVADGGILDGQIPILSTPFQNGKADHRNFFDPVSNMFSQNGKIGKTSKAREELGSPRGPDKATDSNKNDRGDYVRKQQPHENVPYRSAKRKLKLALQEFYRGLELLKSYALLNRTAFRKINKKYDKAVMARPPLRYMSEKVNNAHFVKSSFVEETLVSIEDLYARYFERGNRKVAVNKLRSHMRAGDHSSVSFRNGLYVAAGAGLAVSGIVNGTPYLFSEDAKVKTEASYLFQIYAGYFLSVLLFLMFVLDCRVWTRHRINYIFVFEYDTRHTLDWRQLAELPCFFLFLNGVFLWITFQFHDEHVLYLYWPIFLIGITVIIIFLPFKILYFHARKWWLYSNWRLLLAGLYPVEFRDFFLGDMYCSETYAVSQMEIFFCVYGHGWNDPAQCNSNHSRVLGFLTTLPAIWRALQCLRRYYDSRNWFPHLANFAKYCCNILYYMTLSMYRIHLTGHMRAIFIAFALINGLYCSFWDVFMDFSLGNPWSKNFLLRDNLAFRRKWAYYTVVIGDVVLRQQWIFYAIFTEDLQHSAVMSFCVGLAEVLRRGAWSLFRVENEHCNNVQKFRASRDIPLPYSVAPSRAGSIDLERQPETDTQSPKAKPTDPIKPKTPKQAGADASTASGLERPDASSSSLRSRRNPVNQSTPGIRALQRVGTAIAAAHSQDFQKKRRPEVVGQSNEDENLVGRSLTDDSDEDEEEEDEHDHGSTRGSTTEREVEAYIDSQEDLSGDQQPRRRRNRTEQNHDANGPESSSGRGSGSNNGGGNQSRTESTRQERDARTLQHADEVDEAEIAEARDRVDRARQ